MSGLTGSALAAGVAVDVLAVGVDGRHADGVELDHVLLLPRHIDQPLIDQVDRLLGRAGRDGAGVVDPGVDAGEDGEPAWRAPSGRKGAGRREGELSTRSRKAGVRGCASI